MTSIILTNAGKDQIAKRRAAAKAFTIDSVKFANVTNLKANPEATDTAPSTIAYTYNKNLNLSYLNPDTVIYSVHLDSSIGNFNFNWVGYYANNVLCFIEHVPLHQKIKTAGNTVGNSFIRNLRVVTSRGADLSGASAPAQTWQVDYTASFQDLSTGIESINQHLYGKIAFLSDAFQVYEKPTSQNDFNIKGGTAYFEGFEVKLANSTYKTHKQDWSGDSDLPTALTAASSATKTQYVFLKITFYRHTGIEQAAAQIHVANTATTSDGANTQGTKIKFYQIAKLTRDTSNQISTAQIQDTRNNIIAQKASGKTEVIKRIEETDQAITTEITDRTKAINDLIASASLDTLKKLETAITNETTARTNADNAIIGGASSNYNTLKKIEDQVATPGAYLNGAIPQPQHQNPKYFIEQFFNKGKNAGDPAGFNTHADIASAIVNETTARTNADTALETKLKGGVSSDYDTLKKIEDSFSHMVFNTTGDFKKVVSHAPWSGRSYPASFVFNHKIWVLGGSDGSYKNDVWSSSDGINWTQATANAPWSVRYGQTSVVFNNKMWILGGWGSSYKNDVWSSSDGINWTQATANAPWSARYTHASIVFNNKMWVLGGRDSSNLKNDVWSSSDGIHWAQATANASWNDRQEHTSIVFNNKMWVLVRLEWFISK